MKNFKHTLYYYSLVVECTVDMEDIDLPLLASKDFR